MSPNIRLQCMAIPLRSKLEATQEELEDLATSFQYAQRYLEKLAQGITLQREGRTIRPETPLQIELIDPRLLPPKTQGHYVPQENVLRLMRGAVNVINISHELNHAIDDYDYFEEVDNDALFASDQLGHPIHTHPLAQACNIEGINTYRTLKRKKMTGGTHTEEENTQFQNLEKK